MKVFTVLTVMQVSRLDMACVKPFILSIASPAHQPEGSHEGFTLMRVFQVPPTRANS